MSQSPDQMLAERRLRAMELALEGARRRVIEADAELETLRRRVAALEAALDASVRTRPTGREGPGAPQDEARVAGLEAALDAACEAAESERARRAQVEAHVHLALRRAAEFERRLRVELTEALEPVHEDSDAG